MLKPEISREASRDSLPQIRHFELLSENIWTGFDFQPFTGAFIFPSKMQKFKAFFFLLSVAHFQFYFNSKEWGVKIVHNRNRGNSEECVPSLLNDIWGYSKVHVFCIFNYDNIKSCISQSSIYILLRYNSRKVTFLLEWFTTPTYAFTLN